MLEQNPWSRFIDATCNGDLNTTIAKKTRVDPATVGRWRAGSTDPKPRQVVEYARAYGLSPISALIASGYLTKEETGIEVTVPTTTLADFAVTALAEELASRLRNTDAGSSAQLFPTTTDLGTDRFGRITT